MRALGFGGGAIAVTDDASLTDAGSTATSAPAMRRSVTAGAVELSATRTGSGSGEELGEFSCTGELCACEPGTAPIRCHATTKHAHRPSAPIAVANLDIVSSDVLTLDAISLVAAALDD